MEKAAPSGTEEVPMDESAGGTDPATLRELKQLLQQLAPATEPVAEQQALLERAAALLEVAEADFQRQAPDPCVASAVFNQGSPFAPPRDGHTVGQLAPLLRDSGAVPLVVSLLDAGGMQPPEQLRLAALRFLLAAFTAAGFQTEDLSEALCAQLMQWALHPAHSNREPSEAELTLQCHAAGLLAVALTATPHCDEAIRSGCCAPLLRLLERGVAAFCAEAEEQQEDPQQRSNLRHLLLRHLVQCAAGVGAYLDVLPPLAAAGGVRLPLRLLRTCLPRGEPGLLCDALHWLAALMAHRRVAEALVDEAGLELLINPAIAQAGSAAAAVLACASLVPAVLQRVAASPLEARVRLFQTVLRLADPSTDAHDASGAARQKAADVLAITLGEPRLLAAFDTRGVKGLTSLVTALLSAVADLQIWKDQKHCAIATALFQAVSLHLRAHLGQKLAGAADAAPVEADGLELRLATLPPAASARLREGWGPWDERCSTLVMKAAAAKSPWPSMRSAELAHSKQQVLALLLLQPGGLQRARSLLCEPNETALTALVDDQLNQACGGVTRSAVETQRAAMQVVASCVGGGPDLRQGTRQLPSQAADQQQLREAFVASGALWRLRDVLPRADGRPSVALERAVWDAPKVVLTMRALAGLAQDADARQTLTRLQVADRVAGLLHEEAGCLGSNLSGSAAAWREPLRAAGTQLLALLTPGLEGAQGLSLAAGAAPALQQLQRAAVAANSHIAFDSQELLGLIRDHLQASGLGQAAAALAEEAQLGAEASEQQPLGFVAPPSRAGRAAAAAQGRERLRMSLSGHKRAQPQQLPAPAHPSLRSAERAACASATVSAGSEAAAGSRLGTIVTAFLRQQHTAACLTASQPLATPAPLSLLHSHALPEARLLAQASGNVSRRLLDRQAAPHGGLFGRKQTRRWLHSRYRHVRSLQGSEGGEEGYVSAVCWLEQGAKLLLGSEGGSLRICGLAGERPQDLQAHLSPVVRLQARSEGGGGGGGGLFLSSSKESVRLWSLSSEEKLGHWQDSSRGVFGGRGAWVAMRTDVGVAAYDCATLQGLELPRELSSPSVFTGDSDLAVERGGQLLLHGRMLWDARGWSRVATLQTAQANWDACAFHPAGLEAILGGEVWDLRMLRLRQCVPAITGASLTFNAAGDVAFASLQAQRHCGIGYSDVPGCPSLQSAVLAVDAADYSTIWRLPLEGRRPLGCAVSPDDASLAVASNNDSGRGGRALLFEIGRGPPQDDESDCEAGEESEAEEEPEGEDGQESEQGYSPRGNGATMGAYSPWASGPSDFPPRPGNYGYGYGDGYDYGYGYSQPPPYSIEDGPDASSDSETEGGRSSQAGSSQAGSAQESDADSEASGSGAE